MNAIAQVQIVAGMQSVRIVDNKVMPFVALIVARRITILTIVERQFVPTVTRRDIRLQSATTINVSCQHPVLGVSRLDTFLLTVLNVV